MREVPHEESFNDAGPTKPLSEGSEQQVLTHLERPPKRIPFRTVYVSKDVVAIDLGALEAEDRTVVISNCASPQATSHHKQPCDGAACPGHNQPGPVLLREIPQTIDQVILELVGDLYLLIEHPVRPNYGLAIHGLGQVPPWLRILGWPPAWVAMEHVALDGVNHVGIWIDHIYWDQKGFDTLEVLGLTTSIQNMHCNRLIFRDAISTKFAEPITALRIEAPEGADRFGIEAAAHMDLGGLPKQTSIRLAKGKTAKIDATESAVADLAVIGGTLHLAGGTVDGLSLVDVETLIFGQSRSRNRPEVVGAAGSVEIPPPMALGVRGNVGSIQLNDGAVLQAIDGKLSIDTILLDGEESENCELVGIRSDQLDHQEMVALGRARRLELHVDTPRALASHAKEAERAGPLTIQRLADRRRRLLALAQDTHQRGHVLAVLRESERDARRRSIQPKLSRERFALAVWRAASGYGERIFWPLVVAVLAIVPLGVGRIGFSKFTSTSWWHEGWVNPTARVESVIDFALPGLAALGIDGSAGPWGTAAKLCSVVGIGAALNAARKLVNRGA